MSGLASCDPPGALTTSLVLVGNKCSRSPLSFSAVDPWQTLKVTSEPPRVPTSVKPRHLVSPAKHRVGRRVFLVSTGPKHLLCCPPRTATIVVTHRPRVHAAQTNSCYRLHLLRAQGMGGCRGKQPWTCWQGVGVVGALLGSRACRMRQRSGRQEAACRRLGRGVLQTFDA